MAFLSEDFLLHSPTARALFHELNNLSPAVGVNTVIHRYRDATRFLELDDPGVILDVDDADAYRRLGKAQSEGKRRIRRRSRPGPQAGS